MRAMFRTSILLLVLSALNPTIKCQDLCQTQFGYEYFIQNIPENTVTNTSIGHVTIFGTDDKIRLFQEPNDYFRFDNVTRNVTLVKELDTDRQAEEIPVLTLNCLILDPLDSRPISITVRVLVDDWNDNTPVFNRDHHHVNISEDALVGSTVYKDAVASDNDKEFSPNSRISYRIVENDFSEYFLIPNPTRSIVTLKESLDYESITNMIVLIEAKDNPSAESGSARSSTATLTVSILDADDQDPVFSSKETYRGKISEDASPGTVVDVNPSLFATDPDSMKYPIQYRLLDIYEVFEIDNTTAQIRTKRLLYDSVKTVTTVTVVVWASQVVNPSRETYTFLIININAANINAPRFSKNLYQVEKLELEPVGSVLVTTTATDTDFGTTITYAIVETVDNFRVDGNGSLILQQALDYEVEREWILQVTASDGSHTATTTVVISVIDVNDNNPVFDPVQSDILINREQGRLVTIVTATDSDRTDSIIFTLDNYKPLFRINNDGEIYIATTQDQLIRDEYNLQVSAHDSGAPPRKDSTIVTVRFPPLGVTLPPTTNSTPRVAQAQVGPEADNMITIVLGALAGVLLIVIVILVIVLIIRQKRMKEALNRAREPKGYAAKGLTYRQAESPDDLPKMDLHYTEDTEGTPEYDGRTTIQNNPLNDHDDDDVEDDDDDDERINEGYLQSSVSDQMDREINEIEIETAVVPYDDDFGYPSGRSKYTGHMRTFQGEDTTSSGSAQSDSTGGSRRVLVNNDDKNGGNKLTSWDSDDKIHTQGADKLLEPGMPNSSKGGKPEITVYF